MSHKVIQVIIIVKYLKQSHEMMKVKHSQNDEEKHSQHD